MSTEMERLRRFLAGAEDAGQAPPEGQPPGGGQEERAAASPLTQLAALLGEDAAAEPLGVNAWRLRTRLPWQHRHGALRLEDVPRRWRPQLAAQLAGCDGTARGLDLAHTVFFDTESLGLSIGAGNVAFLVGFAYFTEQALVCDQLLLDDFDGEPYLLEAAADVLAQRPVPVSFNGKSFDLPLLEARFRLAGKRLPAIQGHWDLLHTCRSLWGRQLPNARLTTLEKRVVQFERHDDLPSSLVPAYYRQYLSERRAPLLQPILHHNRWDLVSLAALTAITCQGVAGSLGLAVGAMTMTADRDDDTATGTEDWDCDSYGMGRLLERWGRHEAALAAYCRAVAASDRGSAVRRRAVVAATRLFKRLERYAEAQVFWERLTAEPAASDLTPLVELAKYYEHQVGDAGRALGYVEQALARLARMRAAVHGQPDRQLAAHEVPGERPADATGLAGLLYRRARLQGRIKRHADS